MSSGKNKEDVAVWGARIRVSGAAVGTDGAADSLADDLFNTLADVENAADQAHQDAVSRQNLDHSDPVQAGYAAITSLAEEPREVDPNENFAKIARMARDFASRHPKF